VDIFLREQVISVSETHVFSSNLLNKATFGFSRGRFYSTAVARWSAGWIHAGQLLVRSWSVGERRSMALRRSQMAARTLEAISVLHAICSPRLIR